MNDRIDPRLGERTADGQVRLKGTLKRNAEQQFRERIVRTDNLPDDGDERRRTSNFQMRRAAQVQLLIDLWDYYFPTAMQLNRGAALELLRLAGDNCVETVYDVILKAVAKEDRQGEPLQYPLSYVKKVLRLQHEQQERADVRTAQPLPNPVVTDLQEQVQQSVLEAQRRHRQQLSLYIWKVWRFTDEGRRWLAWEAGGGRGDPPDITDPHAAEFYLVDDDPDE